MVQTCQGCVRAPARASFPVLGRPISGARIQKLLPYPPWSGVSSFGSVSAAADWQGLDAPFIVELFTVCVFPQNPGGCLASGGSVSPLPGSRRQRTFHEPVELCTRSALRLWSRVPWGDLQCSLITAHPLRIKRLRRIARQSISRSPVFARLPSPYEIESGDFAWLVARDYFRKPLSNVAGQSPGTTLYGTRT